MNIVMWIVFGLIFGLLANAIDSSKKDDFYRSSLLGIVGALAGGLLANILFDRVSLIGFNGTAFLIVIASSICLLIFGKSIRKI